MGAMTGPYRLFTVTPIIRARGCRSLDPHLGSKDDQSTILAMMTRWLKEIEGVQTKQSLMQHVLAVKEFAQSQSANCTVDRTSAAVSLANSSAASSCRLAGAKRPSTGKSVQCLRCGGGCGKRGFVEENPWQGQGSFGSAGKQERPKRAYEAQELVRLLTADPRATVGSRYGPRAVRSHAAGPPHRLSDRGAMPTSGRGRD